MTGRRILCLNSGSSSLKYALYEIARNRETALLTATVLGNGGAQGTTDALAAVAAQIRSRNFDVHAVAHRIVFGGPKHAGPEVVSDDLIAELETLVPFDPLHMPPALALLRAARERFAVPHVACFDTAFFRRLPALAQRIPLPLDALGPDVRRYGFHGLSYEYVVGALGDDARGRLVIAHLGSGASLAAFRDGVPVDTTMGLTPLGGIVMGTRPGDLDPGVILYLLRERGYDAAGLTELFYEKSGLRGISETTADVAELLRLRATDSRAEEALNVFAYSVRKAIGTLVAALGGLDTLVFTGGIGEHAAPIRDAICTGLGHLAPAPQRIRVIATNETLMMARHAAALISRNGARR
jgi:acetate kinase